MLPTPPGPSLFPPWGHVRRDPAATCERAGIAKISCNDFRRTFATSLAEQGGPEAVTASLLGHASTAMVRRVYAQIGWEAQQRAGATLPETCRSPRRRHAAAA
jgi:integrase